MQWSECQNCGLTVEITHDQIVDKDIWVHAMTRRIFCSRSHFEILKGKELTRAKPGAVRSTQGETHATATEVGGSEEGEAHQTGTVSPNS